MSPRLSFAIETAKLAGDSTLELFRSARDYELKENHTPVTQADLGAERLIRERIAAHYPGEEILGEEEGGDPNRGTTWVVDPIDGTKSFVAGVPLFATLLAFEEDGVPILGVAYFPALKEIVYAETGSGAFWNGAPCRVRSEARLSHAIICGGGHKSMYEQGRSQGFQNLANQCLASRTWCDAYGHALVATGRVDAMVDPIVSRWDISAIAIIVQEAGGLFTDFAGAHRLSDEALSCTPSIQPYVLEAFKA